MATMSSYELKITGLLKSGIDEAKAAAAAAAFVTMCQDPATAPAGSWSPTFFPPSDTTYGADTPVEEGNWELLPGSLVKAGTQVKKDSTLNALPICQDFTVPVDTPITGPTVLKEGSLLKQGTVVRNATYTTLLWKAGCEDTPAWGLAAKPGEVDKYKDTDWYKRLIAELIKFNDYWGGYMNVLEEEVRIRDLKWYCGNGSGP